MSRQCRILRSCAFRRPCHSQMEQWEALYHLAHGTNVSLDLFSEIRGSQSSRGQHDSIMNSSMSSFRSGHQEASNPLRQLEALFDQALSQAEMPSRAPEMVNHEYHPGQQSRSHRRIAEQARYSSRDLEPTLERVWRALESQGSPLTLEGSNLWNEINAVAPRILVPQAPLMAPSILPLDISSLVTDHTLNQEDSTHTNFMSAGGRSGEYNDAEAFSSHGLFDIDEFDAFFNRLDDTINTEQQQIGPPHNVENNGQLQPTLPFSYMPYTQGDSAAAQPTAAKPRYHDSTYGSVSFYGRD